MRRILSTITVLAFVGILFAQEVAVRRVVTGDAEVAVSQPQTDSRRTPQRRRVDFMADVVRPYNQGTDSIVCLIGNFAAHHNGAVISCDSAVRYSDTRWGFFRGLIINQDSIYIYGDSAIYDGDVGVAEIYAPIVKVIDGDALLYTYNFKFNTETRVGSYEGGGVLVHDNNIIESQRGYYYSQSHDIACVEQVELHGADYDMKSDSIIYNTDSELAQFFTSSEIWNADGDYLSADAGLYDKAQDLYMITHNGYILTVDQELWGDTLSYYRSRGYVEARGNIQMDDFKQKMMAFGDYAEYWNEQGNMLLTRRPSVLSYDLSQSDSIFMRADTIMIRTISLLEERRAAEAAERQAEAMVEHKVEPKTNQGATPVTRPTADGANSRELPARLRAADTSFSRGEDGANLPVADRSQRQDLSSETLPSATPDEVSATDSLAQDSVTLAPKELKAQAKEQARKIKEQERQAKAAARKIELDSIARVRQAKVTAMLNRQKEKELARATKDSIRLAERRAKLVSRGRDVAALDREDSLATLNRERLRAGDEEHRDSTAKREFAEAPTETDSVNMVEGVDSIAADSVYRLLKAYRGVKMYRKDAQMVCDSLVSSNVDSVVHLFVEPVLWNGANQLASEKMELYTRNQQLERAAFLGNPIMVGEVDGRYFNQVTGKKMVAYFRDSKLYRDDVDGNVQTIYFRTVDEESNEVIEMTYLESASASFYLEDQQLVGITYRNEVPFTLYPIGLVPPTQSTELPNFKWVPERRPSLEEVFDRTLRPSQREAAERRARPTFRIVERMDRRKEALLMNGEWFDREEDLSPEVIEWRDSRDR